MNVFREFKRSAAEPEVNTFSGFLIANPSMLEVTLTSSPASVGAQIQIKRNTGEFGGEKVQFSISNITFTRKSIVKKQVFGPVLSPWLEDYFGDICDPRTVELCVHTYMRNLAIGQVKGDGVGYEHQRFGGLGHPIECIFDRTGALSGVPDTWWVGLQITDEELWDKVAKGEITGFSLGGHADFNYIADGSSGAQAILENIPNLSNVSEEKPAKRSIMPLTETGKYSSKSQSYADDVNKRLPINSFARSLAVLRYLSAYPDDLDYNRGEMLYLFRRAVANFMRFSTEAVEDSVFEGVKVKLQLMQKSKVPSLILSMLGLNSTSTSTKEEEIDMTEQELRDLLETTVDKTVKKAMEANREEVKNLVDTAIAASSIALNTKVEAAIETHKSAVDTKVQSIEEKMESMSKSVNDSIAAFKETFESLTTKNTETTTTLVTAALEKATKATEEKLEAFKTSLTTGRVSQVVAETTANSTQPVERNGKDVSDNFWGGLPIARRSRQVGAASTDDALNTKQD